MPQIKFVKAPATINVNSGVNLMEALLEAQIPVASSCKGEGICCKCKVRIASGRENLSQESETELLRREQHSIPKDERLSCQTLVTGDVTIDTTYW
jgi:2Fe-2S ferredoxin